MEKLTTKLTQIGLVWLVACTVPLMSQLSEPVSDLPPEVLERAEKTYFMPFMEVRVVNGVTELQWRDDDGEYVAWSSINGNHLRVMAAVETERSYFSFFGSIRNETVEEINRWNTELAEFGGPEHLKKSIPQSLSLDAKGFPYVFVKTPKSSGASERAHLFMEDLHAYYEANKASITATYDAKEAIGWVVPKVDRSRIPKNRQIYSITDPSEIARIKGER